MVERTRIKEIIDTVLKGSQADATEVLVFAEDSQLTRFANSSIHQHVAETNMQVRVRAISGRRQDLVLMRCNLDRLWQEYEDELARSDWQRTR